MEPSIPFSLCALFAPALSTGLGLLGSLLSTRGMRLQQENRWQQEELLAPTRVDVRGCWHPALGLAVQRDLGLRLH